MQHNLQIVLSSLDHFTLLNSPHPRRPRPRMQRNLNLLDPAPAPYHTHTHAHASLTNMCSSLVTPTGPGGHLN